LKISFTNSDNVFDTMRLVKSMIVKWNSDIPRILLLDKTENKIHSIHEPPKVTDIYNYLRSIYKIEKGEILQRPLRTYQFGFGDCDDQTIFMCSFLLQAGARPDEITIIMSGQNSITHIFLSVRGDNGKEYYLDMLPQRSFNELYPYPVLRKFRFDTI
jgi:hypothetical protein